jgi:tripartite-type tricarboxylate transporter receptor subunit TctC
MKNFLSILFLLLYSNVSFASNEVQIYWAGGIANNNGIMLRSLVDNANRIQNKYKFIIFNKPGAGGSIAALATLESNSKAILAASSTFYVAPHLYKESFYDINDFVMINRLCINRPFAIYSKKYSNLVSGMSLGVASGTLEIIPKILQKEYKNIVINSIPYKTTVESNNDLLGGHIDAAVDYMAISSSQTHKHMNIIGITGKTPINNYRSLPGLENLVLDFFIFANKKTDLSLINEYATIFNRAVNEIFEEKCKLDMGDPIKDTFINLGKIHTENASKWNALILNNQ